MGGQSVDYILAHPDSEPYSQSVLSHAFQPFTVQVFGEAGIEEGMRILEIGSGGGDLALLAAEFVGPSGSVVGIESSQEAVSYATARALVSDLHNVTFVQAGIDQDLPFEPEFDALVGRIVLMFVPSPAPFVRKLAHFVKPGGLVIFQEPDMSWAKSVPNVPIVENAAGWMREVFRRSGADSEMGPRLHAIFKEAGLPDPRMRVDGLIYGSGGAGPSLLTEAIRAMLPAIEELGLASARDIQIDTFEHRMRAELESANASMSSPLLVSAWSRIPD